MNLSTTFKLSLTESKPGGFFSPEKGTTAACELSGAKRGSGTGVRGTHLVKRLDHHVGGVAIEVCGPSDGAAKVPCLSCARGPCAVGQRPCASAAVLGLAAAPWAPGMLDFVTS